MNFLQNKKNQSGQTLIETVVAIFVLSMGIISALSVATYSFQAANKASKQVIGTAIARQQIEAMKSVRDSNWLAAWDPLADCSADFGGNAGDSSQMCHANWLGLAGGVQFKNGQFGPVFNDATGLWSFVPIQTDAEVNNQNINQYALNVDPSTGIYSVANTGGPASVYSGKVVVTLNTAAPFNKTANPEVDMVSTVWWQGEGCPTTKESDSVPASCKVVLEMHLTNWRNY